MQLSKNFHTYIGFDNDYEDSDIVVFGAPFDGTTSNRPGTRFASMYMRNESYALETYSPYMDMDLEDFSIFDGGDIELPFGNVEKTLSMIKSYTENILIDSKIPLMIGGEHLVSLPTIQACSEKYKDMVVIHFDAHADLRDEYMGEKLSHATVMRRVSDIVGSKNVYQYGIRSGTKEEFIWGKENTNFYPLTCSQFIDGFNVDSQVPIYVTIDLDVLDPSIFPGTGTQEPGGIDFNTMMNIIAKFKRYNIVGADLVELSPHYDNTGVSTAVACKILRELTLAILNK